MATIGQALPSPETGWKRIEDTSGAISFGSSFDFTANASASGGNYKTTTSTTDKVSFRFKGTKMRIIGFSHTSLYSNSVDITIDGVLYNFSQTGATASVYQALNFEKTGLEDVEHTVEIKNNNGIYLFDPVDIQSTARLIHPDEVFDFNNLEVGKRIRFNYVASSGAVGSFSGIGKETRDFSSPASSATPNGDAYFIMVDTDYKGRKILVADRNIQHSISWNILNTAGIASGSGLPITKESLGITSGSYDFALRLLTGGISSSDKDNEWDKYIVNSTLNGAIVAGGLGVWNWSGINSHTSTTNASSSGNRTQRGNTAVTASANRLTSSGASTDGFRPVLIVESLPVTKSFIYVDESYKKYNIGTQTWDTVSTTLPSTDTFMNEGMDDFSALNRKTKSFTQIMVDNGALGSGKVFKAKVDLKRFIDLIGLNVR